MRLSIEVAPEQHRQLKAVAALYGQSVKAYVLERALSQASMADDDIRQLDAFLEQRLQESAVEPHKSVIQIFEAVRQSIPRSNASV